LHFAPDTEETLEFTTVLANTHPTASKSGTDELATPEALTTLFHEVMYSGRIDGDETELEEVRQTRDLLREVWSLDLPEAVAEVNRMLSEANALPFLTKHDHFDWHLHATAAEAPLAERIRVEVALALADVIRSGATDRMRVCDADDCTGLLIDLSRNGSKRFCSVRCGNRMNMVAYRERQNTA